MKISRTLLQTPQLGAFKLPALLNEPMLNYEPGSAHRLKLKLALDEMRKNTPHITSSKSDRIKYQKSPTDHSFTLCEYEDADKRAISEAIAGTFL
jgi:hypothetical protein